MRSGKLLSIIYVHKEKIMAGKVNDVTVMRPGLADLGHGVCIAREADVMVDCTLNRGKMCYSAHIKLYEYMAMEKPIVVVDLPSIREEIVDGKTALLARPEDPKDLTKKIRTVLTQNLLSRLLSTHTNQRTN